MIRGLLNVLTKPSVRRDWRFLTLLKVGRWVMPGYRFQWPQFAWWQDPDFNAYLQRFGELRGMNSDRRWSLYELTKLVQNVPGDTAECGVLEGSSSYLICKALAGRRHFMFDSFEGLSTPGAQDGTFWSEHGLSADLAKARENLAEFPQASFHPGWIPERFRDVEDRDFCFVHIDVQLYRPTRDSLEFFYPRVNPAGIILCDDYGFVNCPGATRSFDEFLADKPERMVRLSCGSAFLVKGMKVAETALKLA